MDSLNIYEYDDLQVTTAATFPEFTVTSPSLDEGSSPLPHGFESPFTPSPSLQKRLSWRALNTSPRPPLPMTTLITPNAQLNARSPRGVLFATSPSPTRPAPSPLSQVLQQRSSSPPRERAVSDRALHGSSTSSDDRSARRREGTVTYQRDPTLSPLAPEMASDTTDSDTDVESDTVVSFSTTDEEDEEDSRHPHHRKPSLEPGSDERLRTTAATTGTAPSATRAAAPPGLPPIAPVAASHPYEIGRSPTRQRSFSPPPPFPGEQVARALEFAHAQQRARSRSPDRLAAGSSSSSREANEVDTDTRDSRSPSPRPRAPAEYVHAQSGTRLQRPSFTSVSVSSSSRSQDSQPIVGVVEYSPSPPPRAAPPRASVAAEAAPFFSLSPYRHRHRDASSSSPAESPVRRRLVCRATVEILPGQTDSMELYEDDDPESCARAFMARHQLREEIALQPLTAFFAHQLEQQQQRPQQLPRREPSPTTVPQLRYKSSTRDETRETAAPRIRVMPHRESSARSSPRFSVSPRSDSMPRSDVPTERAESRERSVSPTTTITSPTVARERVRSLSRDHTAAKPLPMWNSSTKAAPSHADTQSEHSSRRPSLSGSVLSQSGGTEGGSSRSRSRQRDGQTSGVVALAPRPTRASLMRAAATRKAQAARTTGPFPSADAEEQPAVPPSRRRAASHQPRTAPGTERLCRERSASLSQRSARTHSRDSSTSSRRDEVNTSSSASTSTSATTPHYAASTQSARRHARGVSAPPPPRTVTPTTTTRPRQAQLPAEKARVPAAKHVSFADDVHHGPPKSRPLVRPTAQRTEPADTASKSVSVSSQRGQRSLFAHVDPNVPVTLSKPSAKRASSPKMNPSVRATLTEAETAAVAEKARRWFTALGASAASSSSGPAPVNPELTAARSADASSPMPTFRDSGTRPEPAPRSHLLRTLRDGSTSSNVDGVATGSPVNTVPSTTASRAHSQLWRSMGLDATVDERSAPSLVRDFDIARESRPFFQPYIGR